MSNLREELKRKIIERLKLNYLSVDQIENNTPLFKDGLGLDSIDALEVAAILKTEYNIDLLTSEYYEHFQNIDTLAMLIEHRQRTSE